jgi:hypothetical protein
MKWFEQNIFKYFGKAAKLYDSYKDADKKGILERYNEIVGNEIDEELIPQLENLFSSLHIPLKAIPKYLFAIEEDYGCELYLGYDSEIRRKVLSWFMKYCAIRGSKKGYEVLFSLLGFDSTVFELYDIADGFDSPRTFDEGHFDSANGCCTEYDIKLYGNVVATNNVLTAIDSIVRFNEPISARLRSVYINDLIVFSGNLNLDCVTLAIGNVRLGETFEIVANIKNTTTQPTTCTLEIDFGYVWENGDTPLDPRNVYQTEDGIYELYNDINFTDMILQTNVANPIVIGVLEDNLTTLLEFQFLQNSQLIKAGQIAFMVDTVNSTVEFAETIRLQENIADLDNVTYSAQAVQGNLVFNVITGNIASVLEFRYRFI